MPTKAVILTGVGRELSTAPGNALAQPDPPPAFLRVANRSLLASALSALERSGVREAALVFGRSMAAEVRRCIADRRGASLEPTLIENDCAARLDTLVSALRDFVADEPFVLHLADSLSHDGLIGLTDAEPQDPRDTVILANEAPAKVVGLKDRGSGDALPAGVWLFGPLALEALSSVGTRPQLDPWIHAVADHLQSLGGSVETRRVTGWWRYRAGRGALLEGNRFALEGLCGSTDGAELVDTDLQGTVLIEPAAELASTTVRGPAIIGRGARLSNAYIGPYTSIGEDVTIEGAEIEHSIVLPGASISHLGRRLEASVIGAGARVFRDFRLPRALRLNVGDGAEVSVV